MSDHPLLVSVECYAWLAPDHRYFKVRTTEGIYILRNDISSGEWELTLFERVGRP